MEWIKGEKTLQILPITGKKLPKIDIELKKHKDAQNPFFRAFSYCL
jgi:hypothetical protein